ncbi:MAG: hypothetical protein IAF08_11275, partial [Rhizobacter sp.]|nr:hypothetical protein [Chlorobiales bacterium]
MAKKSLPKSSFAKAKPIQKSAKKSASKSASRSGRKSAVSKPLKSPPSSAAKPASSTPANPKITPKKSPAEPAGKLAAPASSQVIDTSQTATPQTAALRLTKAIATERDAPAVSEGSPRLNDRPPPEDSAASMQLPGTDAVADARLPSTDAATGFTEATEDSLADAIVDMKENSDAKPDAEERLDEDVDEEIKVELPKDLPTPHDDKPTSREEDFALIDQTRDGDTQERDAAYKRLLSKYR